MLTSRPAAIWQGRQVHGGEGLEGHAVAVGNPADLIIWPVPTEDDAIRTLPMRRYVLKRGQVVAETRPEVSYVQGREVRFLR
jgi:cytosine deaminase